MRVVLPVHHFPPRYSAGAELYTFRLARWLLSHDHAPEVVCVEQLRRNGQNCVAATREEYEGVPVWRLLVETSPAGGPARSFDNPELAAWFADYLAHRRPDLAHFQAGYLIGAGPLRAAVAAGIPTVLTLHDFWFLCPRITLLRGDGTRCDGPPADPGRCAWCMRLDGRTARLADRVSGGAAGHLAACALGAERRLMAERRATLHAALALPAAVIAPSRFLAAQFRLHVAPERLHVLRYGLDAAHLATTPPPPPDDTLRLGYIGQIAGHKGVHLLIKAIRRLPAAGRPVLLTIHGDLEQHGAYSHRLRAMAGNDPRICFAGRFAASRLPAVLGALHATVVPSLWYENSPLAIMEAHAAGRPVLTSALGGMSELVRDEIDGLQFRPGDVADLARQIERLRSEPGLLARLRRGVSAPASVDSELDALLQIYAAVGAPTGRGHLATAPTQEAH
jgi:glycosyltransferase involved in cell wall biosynthesis